MGWWKNAGKTPRPQDAAAGGDPLFGDVSPSEGERLAFHLAQALPVSLIVATATGAVTYCDPRAAFAVERGRIAADEIKQILALVAADSVQREREIEFHGERFFSVRVAALGDNRFAVFLQDVTAPRRAAALQREFVTNVSHELKTPIGAISLLAETIGDAADDADMVQHFSQRIVGEASRLADLVQRLIELGRVGNGNGAGGAAGSDGSGNRAFGEDGVNGADGVAAEPETDVVAAAADAIDATHAAAHIGNIAVSLYVEGHNVTAQIADHGDVASVGGARPDDGAGSAAAPDATALPSLPVRASAKSVGLVLKNLVENAVRYSDPGETVHVVVSREPETDGEAARVKVQVIDHGIGIAKAEQENVFERFYRVDRARSRDTGGSGLGLAIVRSHVEQSGGELTLWSAEGEGATFAVSWPAA